ncbi:MAG: AMP-binding protein [Burkholderiaceae bacterium]
MTTATNPLGSLSREPASVYAALQASAQAHADQPMLVVPSHTAKHYDIAAEEVSYAQALATVNALRDRYAAAGWRRGHRVGLLVENRPAFFWHWLALNALGISVVPINAEFRAAELQYLIEDANLALAIALPSHHQRLADAAAALKHDLPIGSHEIDADIPSAPKRDAVPNAKQTQPDLSTECALLYTSGTTGSPKGCILPNEYFIVAGVIYREMGGICPIRPGRERLLSPLPLVHMNAMACSSVAMIITGGAIVLVDRFHPGSWWETVRESRASIIHYLGVMPAILLRMPESEQDRQHEVIFGFGAGVAKADHAPFEERFGFPLSEGWAMTETGMGGAILANHEPRKIGTANFGQLPVAVEARIIDEQGKDCPSGENGELLVRRAGPDPSLGFFKGYLNKEEATREAWEGGWFHTGDIVRADEHGYYYFVDRRKNVIRRSGENIAAVEVEAVLMQHEGIAACGVAPVPDEIRGDEVMACVVLSDEANAGSEAEQQAFAQDVMRFCLDRLAYYKAPGYLAFVDKLPLTATQKVQRGELKKTAAACAEQALGAAGPAHGSIDLREFKKRNG